MGQGIMRQLAKLADVLDGIGRQLTGVRVPTVPDGNGGWSTMELRQLGDKAIPIPPVATPQLRLRGRHAARTSLWRRVWRHAPGAAWSWRPEPTRYYSTSWSNPRAGRRGQAVTLAIVTTAAAPLAVVAGGALALAVL